MHDGKTWTNADRHDGQQRCCLALRRTTHIHRSCSSMSTGSSKLSSIPYHQVNVTWNMIVQRVNHMLCSQQQPKLSTSTAATMTMRITNNNAPKNIYISYIQVYVRLFYIRSVICDEKHFFFFVRLFATASLVWGVCACVKQCTETWWEVKSSKKRAKGYGGKFSSIYSVDRSLVMPLVGAISVVRSL